MKLDFGPNPSRPILAATISPDEQEQLWNNHEAIRARNELHKNNQLLENLQGEGRVRLHFRVRKISDQKEAGHEEQFAKVIGVIGGAAGYNHEPADNRELRALSVGPVGPDIHGKVSLAAELALPDVEDGQLSHFVSRIMRNMAMQLRYEQKIAGRKGGIGKLVFAEIRREAAGKEKVLLETNPSRTAHMALEHFDGSRPEPVVNLVAYDLASHKQQLVCLAGLAAIAQAEAPAEQA
jgi:hypothetical protein